MDASSRNVQVRTLSSRESTILVVDDEVSGRDLMSSLLSSQGYRVETASDGVGGLALIERGGIHLVLLDLMMSRMDGVEVCAHIRSDTQHALMPIVFTTSLHDRASRIRAKEAGADDFLVKPVDGLELLVRVDRLLRNRAQVELVYAERDRLARELAETRAALAALSESAAESAAREPQAQLEQLARVHRHSIAEALETCGLPQESDARVHLQEMLREAEEIERGVAATTMSFPLSRTRSTL